MIFTSGSWTCHAFMQRHTSAVSLLQVIYSYAKRKDHRGRQEAALPIRLVSLVLEDILRTYKSLVSRFQSNRESLSLPLTCIQQVMLALVCFDAQALTGGFVPLSSNPTLARRLALYLLCTSCYPWALLALSLLSQIGASAIHVFHAFNTFFL